MGSGSGICVPRHRRRQWQFRSQLRAGCAERDQLDALRAQPDPRRPLCDAAPAEHDPGRALRSRRASARRRCVRPRARRELTGAALPRWHRAAAGTAGLPLSLRSAQRTYQITGPLPAADTRPSCGNLVSCRSPTTAILHNFFQMWQQSDCNIAYATPENPSGCPSDLYTWVAVSVGWAIGRPPTTDQGTAQGGVAMGFFANMLQGDLPTSRASPRPLRDQRQPSPVR